LILGHLSVFTQNLKKIMPYSRIIAWITSDFKGFLRGTITDRNKYLKYLNLGIRDNRNHCLFVGMKSYKKAGSLEFLKGTISLLKDLDIYSYS